MPMLSTIIDEYLAAQCRLTRELTTPRWGRGGSLGENPPTVLPLGTSPGSHWEDWRNPLMLPAEE